MPFLSLFINNSAAKIISLAFCLGHATLFFAFSTQIFFHGHIQFPNSTWMHPLEERVLLAEVWGIFVSYLKQYQLLYSSQRAHVILINVNRNLTCIQPHSLLICCGTSLLLLAKHHWGGHYGIQKACPRLSSEYSGKSSALAVSSISLQISVNL